LENFKHIPYGRQDVNNEDIEAVTKVLRSEFITQGPVVPLFEQKLCCYTEAKYSVVVNSCTAALHLSCLALGLGPGDILWTSPITFVASANCALYCGATVDFVDIEPDTGLMSVENLKRKLKLAEKNGNLPKIVIPVHFSGQPCNMKEIYCLGKKYGFKIIEDAAHAIGAKYQNKSVGNCQYSDITVFSFHPVKIITTAEGGAAMTNNPFLAEKMKLLRSHGITRNLSKMRNKSDGPWHYEQIDLGFNYRMTDIQAALGISQLNRLDKYVSRRSEISDWYDKQFINLSIDPLVNRLDRVSSFHLYVVRVGNEIHRKKLYNYLLESGVRVNVHYIPVYKHAYYNNHKPLNESELYYKKAISLPIFPSLSDGDLNYIMNKIMYLYTNEF